MIFRYFGREILKFCDRTNNLTRERNIRYIICK